MCGLGTATKLWVACAFCVMSSIAAAVTPMIQGGSNGALIMKSDASLWVVGPSCNDTGNYDCVFTSPVRATNLSGAKSIATGLATNFVVKEDGTVWTWGQNRNGTLGVGLAPSNNQFRLQQVTALNQIQAVHCQWNHCLALGRDGRVWSWGENNFGQVGDGTTIDRWTPILINGLPTITQIWATAYRSLALATDGSIWTWGQGLGQVPALYGGAPNLISNVTAVAGTWGDVFLKSDGSVWASGNNDFGQRGNGSVFVLGNSFTRVNNLSDIIAVSAQGNRFLALRRDGTVWAWGSNINGAMGAGSFTQAVYDQPVMLALQSIVAIDVGNVSSYAIASDGTIYGWGNNETGGLGDNGASNRASPVRMIGPGGSGLFNVNLDQVPTNRLPLARFSVTPTQGAAPLLVTVDGSASTDPDGTIVSYQWFSSDGQTRSGKQATFTFNSGGSYVIRPLVTDNAGATATWFPTQIIATASFGVINTSPMLAAGEAMAALRSDGKAFSWGPTGSLGRLEPPSVWQGTFPKFIENLAGITQISMGIQHGLAVLVDGTLAAWGFNSYGQLGDGTTRLNQQIPITVAGLSNMIEVSAGFTHSLALKSDGTVYAWGTNHSGQFGTGAFTDSFVPVRSLGISDVAAIATPMYSSVALKRDGTVWAWGNNTRGELGIGTRAVTPSPAQILGLTGISKIWCKVQHCFARGSNGSTWAWGASDAGSLGAGMLTGDALSPIRVTLLDGFSEFALMGTAALGLKSDGTVWAWGDNGLGQLGQGFTSTASQLTPVRVPNIANAIQIAFGGNGTGYALRADGTVRSWGENRGGTIGDGTLARRLSPVSVTNTTLDGPLDLLPDVPNDTGASLDPLFYVQTASTGDLSASTVVVDSTVRFRPTDVGTTASTYVFALAPATLVKGAALKGGAGIDDPAYHINLKTTPSTDAKDGPLACVLAQLNSAGQLTAVSASNLQAYVTGVLSAGGVAVNVLNNISAAAIQGSTFYVGYGATGTSMINNGVNRSVASIPGTQTCQPQAPQTGWWWDATQRDRGYGIEVRGNNLYYVSFMNNPSGTPSWMVASGPTALDGSLFQASLVSYANGQTLTGAMKAPTGPSSEGLITISTATATQGTLIAPAGTRSIERMAFIPNGLTTTPQSNQPESGWWWNTTEPGRGYFIEWQNGYASVTGYMYDDAGKAVWYQSMPATPDPRIITGTWNIFGNGNPLTQAGSGVNQKLTRLTDNFAPVSIRFSDGTNGVLTLPGGRNIAITRLRF